MNGCERSNKAIATTIDSAVLAMLKRSPRTPFLVHNRRPPLSELAQAFRSRTTETPPLPFDGRIKNCTIPVRWGTVLGRLYRPSSAAEWSPAVAFFHSGGFIAGDLQAHDGLCRELATPSRTLLGVDYRFAPEHPFPAGLEDAYDATDWLAGAAAGLGADLRRLAVASDSAGAIWRPGWR